MEWIPWLIWFTIGLSVRKPLGLSVSLSVCLSICLSACPSTCLPVYLSICLFVCLPICLLACPPVCLPVCLSVCLSACLSACFSVCLLACRAARSLVCPSALSFVRLPVSLSVPSHVLWYIAQLQCAVKFGKSVIEKVDSYLQIGITIGFSSVLTYKSLLFKSSSTILRAKKRFKPCKVREKENPETSNCIIYNIIEYYYF